MASKGASFVTYILLLTEATFSKTEVLLSEKVTFVGQRYFCVTHGVTIRLENHLRILSFV